MTAVRRNLIRRIIRETGRPARAVVRAVWGFTAVEIAQQYQRTKRA